MPHAEYNRKKVEELKLAIQGVLSVLSLQSPPLDENPSASECPTAVAPATSDDITTSVAESGTSLVPPSPIFHTILTAP